MVSSFRPSYLICIYHVNICIRVLSEVDMLCLADVYISLHTYSCIPYRWNDTSGAGMLSVLVIHTGILLAVPISADNPFYASNTQGSLRRESSIPLYLLICRSGAHLLCLMRVNKHSLYYQLILHIIDIEWDHHIRVVSVEHPCSYDAFTMMSVDQHDPYHIHLPFSRTKLTCVRISGYS